MATLFYSTNGSEWLSNDNWLDYDQHECDWYSTYNNDEICKEDGDSGERIVKDLMQWGNNLYGPIPP